MDEVWKGVLIGGVSGLVLLLMQLVALPRLEQRKTQFTERWKAKRDAFLEALLLLDRYMATKKLNGPRIPKTFKPSKDKPSPMEINRALVMLGMVSEDPAIPEKFISFFQVGGRFTFTDRGAFIVMLRSELFGSQSKMDPAQFPYFV